LAFIGPVPEVVL
jgi:hypothetical protein